MRLLLPRSGPSSETRAMVDVPGGDALRGALVQPDSYCPIIRGQRFSLRIRMARSRDLPKLSSSCTTVVIGARDGIGEPLTIVGAAPSSISRSLLGVNPGS